MATVVPVETFSGWLCMGPNSENLSRYWFVLQDDSLVYYNQQQEPRTQEGSLSLELSTVSIGASTRKFCFELQSESKIYHLVADDAVQMQEWMTNIRKAALRIRRQKTTLLTKKNVTERRNFAEASETLGERVTLDEPAEEVPKPADDRLGVYQQWLAETKAKQSQVDSGKDVLHRQLLSDSERPHNWKKGGRCRCGCCSCCSVS